MQFVNQLKTVLILLIGYFLFPQPQTMQSILMLLGGLCCTFVGVGYYTKLKSGGGAKAAALPVPLK